MEWWKREQEIITRNLTHKLLHKLPNNLGLTILRNEGLLRLLTWVFIDLMIRGFELVTLRLEPVTRGFELVTRRFELVTRGFELVTRRFELITRGFERTLVVFNSCF